MLGYNRINGKYAHLLRTLYTHRQQLCTAQNDNCTTFGQIRHLFFFFLSTFASL